MAQKQSVLFKRMATARMFNEHVSGVISPGPYEGLMIVPTSPRTMKVGITAGFAFTDEGVKIEETTDVGIEQTAQDAPTFLEIEAPDESLVRRDLIVLRHRFREYGAGVDPSVEPNIAEYVVIKGTPVSPTFGIPPVNEADIQPGDIPLAEIEVRPGMLVIDKDDIYNRLRTMNSDAIIKYLSKALYIGLGNFIFEGWDITGNVLNIAISPGSGLINGIENSTDDTVVLSTLRAQEYLLHPRKYNNETGLYDGDYSIIGENLDLYKDMDYPTQLEINITPIAAAIPETYIYFTGLDGSGNIVNAEPVKIACPNIGETYTFYTTSKFAKIDTNGIDAHLPAQYDPTARICIKDNPIAYIYAIGTNSGRPVFTAQYYMDGSADPNKYYIGSVRTNMEEVVPGGIEMATKGSFSEEIEDLSEQATGVNRVFTLKFLPVDNSETFVIDGLVLRKNSLVGKGYTLQGRTITLQDNVVPPDGSGMYTGSDPAEVWIRYKKMG